MSIEQNRKFNYRESIPNPIHEPQTEMSKETRFYKLKTEFEELKNTQSPSDLVIEQIRNMQTEITNLKNAISEDRANIQSVQLDHRTNSAEHEALANHLSRLEDMVNRLAVEVATFLHKAQTFQKAKSENQEKFKIGDVAAIMANLKGKLPSADWEGTLEAFATRVDPNETAELVEALNPYSIIPEEIERSKKKFGIPEEEDDEK